MVGAACGNRMRHGWEPDAIRVSTGSDTEADFAVSLVRRTGEGREDCPMNSECSRREPDRLDDGVAL